MRVNQLDDNNLGILQDIDKLVSYSYRKAIQSIQSRVFLFGDNIFQQQIKSSCLILQNQIISEIQSQQQQQIQVSGEKVMTIINNIGKQKQDQFQCKQQFGDDLRMINKLECQKDTFSFHNNLTRNQSLVAQMNLTYGREINNRDQYSQALRLFLKWVHYFNQHAYGGFLKTLYKGFTQSLYSIDRSDLQTLIDQVSIFVQSMVKVYTQIYRLEEMNKLPDGKLFKNQNIYNLIMTFLFRKTKIKAFVKVIIRYQYEKKIKKFQEQLKKYHKKGISHFGIDNKFILIRNEQWDKILSTKPNKAYHPHYHTKIHHHPTKPQPPSTSPQPQQSQLSLPIMLQSFKSRVQSSCYERSLRLVSELSSNTDSMSPISKLKTIIEIAKMIKQQIQGFYLKELDFAVEEIPELDPDNLMAIVIYLIVANNNPVLFEELKMVEYFTTTNTLNCISGYYLNMFIASIEMVLELNI